MPQDPSIVNPAVATPPSAEIGQPDQPNVIDAEVPGEYAGTDPGKIDRKYWIACLDDAERAERDWRQRAKDIIEIYRNEGRNRSGKLTNGPVTFNILYANTEVTLPAIYQKPPQPVVRSRFVKASAPQAMPMPPMMPPPGMMPPGMPPTQPAAAASLPPEIPLPPPPGLPPVSGPPLAAGMGGPPPMPMPM